jgi:phosphoserine phosphatase RsbU/P
VSVERFWRRVTDGLEISQLWKQFVTDARASYRLYQRDLDKGEPQQETPGRRFLHTAQALAWAVLEKLSPARRVLLLIAVVLLLFGAAQFNYTNQEGHPQTLSFDLRFQAGALLLLLLVLEISDRVVMKRDLEIARDIQKWLLPSEPPKVPGLDVAFAARPANTVAGDFYDVFPRTGVSGAAPTVLFVVADVAGKSIPAALLMATFQASLRTLSMTPCELGGLVSNLNHYACTNSQGGLRFTTAFLAEFDPTARTLHYINAGHNTPVLRRASGSVERLTYGGLPFGIQDEARYESGDLVLETGDRLVIFTDGLVEAENAGGEQYEEARLLDLMKTNAQINSTELLRQIMTSLDAFVGATPQHDDVTCMVVSVLGAS